MDKNILKPTRPFLILTSLLFFLLFLRTAQLQVLHHTRYARLSERNRIKVITTKAPRGRILSRDGVILADNRPGYSVAIFPDQLREKEKTLLKLASILNQDPEKILKKVEEGVPESGRIFVAKDVDVREVAIIEEHHLDLPGVRVEVEPLRYYPYGSLACHLLGYVSSITQDEYSTREKRYSRNDLIGKMGFEDEYESFLKGEDGVEFVEVDALGREKETLLEKPPIPPRKGNDILLTLDFSLQNTVEEAFGDHKKGCVVCLNPGNGEVLALLSKPGFDPNLLSRGLLTKEIWEDLANNPDSPLWNRATLSSYPPGSVFKLVTVAAAMDLDLLKENPNFVPCTGSYRIGNRIFRCWKTHGTLSREQSIIQSCDVFFYQVGLRLGIDRLTKKGISYRLIERTEIDFRREGKGLIPTPSWYDRRYGKGKWSWGMVANLAIGQGEILLTPLKTVQFIAAISNGGNLVQPHLMKEIRSPSGEVIQKGSALGGTKSRLPISMETLTFLKKAMAGVVNDPKGTGSLARVKGIRVGGKTGTAQNPYGEDHALFVTFAPYEEPQIACVVIVENGGMGGGIAAPIAGKILRAYFQNNEKLSMQNE
ncbi:penicillin-binding protein 2 [candidate division TA06 bacterium]|nr:penicillin-binding protein 2 [candidate division TA06 bacterium]